MRLIGPLDVTTTGTPVVLAPTDLKIHSVSASSVALSWTGPADVVGFDVFRGMSSGDPYSKANASLITDASFTDMGLKQQRNATVLHVFSL